jgi:hypothetical protein
MPNVQYIGPEEAHATELYLDIGARAQEALARIYPGVYFVFNEKQLTNGDKSYIVTNADLAAGGFFQVWRQEYDAYNSVNPEEDYHGEIVIGVKTEADDGMLDMMRYVLYGIYYEEIVWRCPDWVTTYINAPRRGYFYVPYEFAPKEIVEREDRFDQYSVSFQGPEEDFEKTAEWLSREYAWLSDEMPRAKIVLADVNYATDGLPIRLRGRGEADAESAHYRAELRYGEELKIGEDWTHATHILPYLWFNSERNQMEPGHIVVDFYVPDADIKEYRRLFEVTRGFVDGYNIWCDEAYAARNTIVADNGYVLKKESFRAYHGE